MIKTADQLRKSEKNIQQVIRNYMFRKLNLYVNNFENILLKPSAKTFHIRTLTKLFII